MALIVEDGSIVIGANSYVTTAEIRAYADSRGISLPAENSALEIMAVLAFDYIESFYLQFGGKRTQVGQRTAWPRTGVVVEDYTVGPHEIPWQLKEAQCQATAEAIEADLMPNPSGGAIKSEKVDVIEVVYQDSAEATTSGGIAYLPKVNAKLALLFGNVLTSRRIRVVRG